MIVRDEGDSYFLITQPDHAKLAETMVSAITTEASLQSGRRSAVLLATREHDNGWIEVDAEPTITDAGRPCDFIEGPPDVKHALWPRGIARAGRLNPRAGALVAEHALTVYAYRRTEALWLPFFTSISALRDALLRESGVSTATALADFEADYRCVRLGDSFSLQFCNGWVEPQETLGYRAVLRDGVLAISPDPFAGARVPLAITGRRIEARDYRSDDDLRAAVAAASLETIAGEALGSE